MADVQQTNPIDQKFFMKSMTIWGILIAAVPGILEQSGVTLTPETLASAQGLWEQGLVAANSLNELVGLGIAAWGRHRAGGVYVVKKAA
jgi:hypothetical protein